MPTRTSKPAARDQAAAPAAVPKVVAAAPRKQPAKPAAAKAVVATKAAKVVVTETPAKPAKEPKPAKVTKAAKEPKARLKPVRDSFTMPEADFTLIATLKARALGAKREAKKSELLRAGLHALAALDTGALVAALNRLAPVKVGRPRKGH